MLGSASIPLSRRSWPVRERPPASGPVSDPLIWAVALVLAAALVLVPIDTRAQEGAVPSDSDATATEVSGEQPADAQITRRIRTRLTAAPELEASAVSVKTRDGIVTLSGSVQNLLVKNRIADLAARVFGVRSIINDLTVEATGPSDTTVQSLVREALAQDPLLGAWGIGATVEGGTVTLTGEVETWQQKEEVARAVERVQGVQQIENRVSVDADTTRTDAAITADVERRLKWDARIDAGLIDAETRGRTVHLSGSVGSLHQKRFARRAARVPGVRDVSAGNLSVQPWAFESPGRKETLVAITDAQIRRAVEEALLLDPRTQPFSIEVTVEDGLVTLTGSVHTLEARRSAEADARHTTGVWRVENEIRVSPLETITDEVIARQITQALLRNPVVEGSAVEVKVENGRAVLEGTVDSYFARVEADEVAARVGGVSAIDNNLAVRGATDQNGLL